MKQNIIFFILFGILQILSPTNGLKILGLFPHPGHSHFFVFQPVMRALADAGHDVTIVSHFPEKNPPKNYKDLPLTGIHELTSGIDLKRFANRPSYTFLLEFFFLLDWGKASCENALNSTHIRNILNTNQKYDIVLMEYFNTDCLLGVPYKLNVPVIGLSSCALMPYHYERIGNPINPSYIPSLFTGYSDDMNYLERLHNWFAVHLINLLYKIYNVREGDKLMRKYIKDDNIPYLGDLIMGTSMMFVNTHYSLNGPKPLTPNLLEIGGTHIKKSQPLDIELQEILDSATDGVVYVSWGSMIRSDTLPEDKRDAFISAFRLLKQKVLWKWENEIVPKKPKNVILRKWLPQRDILCHPNLRLFISHGGLLGTSEAAYCGVPMVVTPIYGDQFLNAAAIENRKMGKIVHYEDISAESIQKAIEEALQPKIMENAKNVSHAYRHRPMDAIESAVWWTELVAAEKGFQLGQSNYKNLSIFVAYSLDIWLTFAIVILTLVIIIRFLIRKCLKLKSSEKIKKQ